MLIVLGPKKENSFGKSFSISAPVLDDVNVSGNQNPSESLELK